MGIKSGYQMFWKTVNLTFDQALVAIRHCTCITTNNHVEASADSLVVALDANLLGYKFLGPSSNLEPADGVFRKWNMGFPFIQKKHKH